MLYCTGFTLFLGACYILTLNTSIFQKRLQSKVESHSSKSVSNVNVISQFSWKTRQITPKVMSLIVFFTIGMAQNDFHSKMMSTIQTPHADELWSNDGVDTPQYTGQIETLSVWAKYCLFIFRATDNYSGLIIQHILNYPNTKWLSE